MTENEKVKKWFKTELSMRIEESLDAIDCEDVMDICIKALEEIQQYREIGLTPKMVKEMIESEKLASHQAIIRGAKLEQYEAIGTIEELKALKEKLQGYKNQMSIYAEQHKVILASDVLDMLEELDWNE